MQLVKHDYQLHANNDKIKVLRWGWL